MSRFLVLAGLALLVGIGVRLRATMSSPDAVKSSGGDAAVAAPSPRRAEAPERMATHVPEFVPPGLVAGWTPTSLARAGGRAELTLRGASTLDKDEVVARLSNLGCPAPTVTGMRDWRVSCAEAGRLRGVEFRAGARDGEGVLSWSGVAR